MKTLGEAHGGDSRGTHNHHKDTWRCFVKVHAVEHDIETTMEA